MKKHSPWLSDLPVTSDWIKLRSLGLEVKFLANSSAINISIVKTSLIDKLKIVIF